jgi:hypothetical protein
LSIIESTLNEIGDIIFPIMSFEIDRRRLTVRVV